MRSSFAGMYGRASHTSSGDTPRELNIQLSIEQLWQASLRSWNAMSYTTVVTDMQADNEAAAPEVAPMLATLVATSIAEQARDRGKDVLLV